MAAAGDRGRAMNSHDMNADNKIIGAVITLSETLEELAQYVADVTELDVTRLKATIAAGVLAQAIVDMAFAHRHIKAPARIIDEAARQAMAEIARVASASTLDLATRKGDPGVTVQ